MLRAAGAGNTNSHVSNWKGNRHREKKDIPLVDDSLSNVITVKLIFEI